MIHSTPPLAADAPPATAPTYEGVLSRSLGVGGNVLITLSGISPASSVFVLGGAALAAYGTGVFWGFAIAGVISLLIAYCYAELASHIRLPAVTTRWSAGPLGPRRASRCSSSAWSRSR